MHLIGNYTVNFFQDVLLDFAEKYEREKKFRLQAQHLKWQKLPFWLQWVTLCTVVCFVHILLTLTGLTRSYNMHIYFLILCMVMVHFSLIMGMFVRSRNRWKELTSTRVHQDNAIHATSSVCRIFSIRSYLRSNSICIYIIDYNIAKQKKFNEVVVRSTSVEAFLNVGTRFILALKTCKHWLVQYFLMYKKYFLDMIVYIEKISYDRNCLFGTTGDIGVYRQELGKLTFRP